MMCIKFPEPIMKMLFQFRCEARGALLVIDNFGLNWKV